MTEQNDNKKIRKSPETHMIQLGHGGGVGGGSCTVLTRERSFVRTSNNQQNANKRRSLAFNNQNNHQQHQNHLRGGKPAMEIYRPPNVRVDGNSLNKLNVNAQEFTMNNSRSSIIFPTTANLLQHSKSTASLQQMHNQLAAAAAAAAAAGRYPVNQQHHHNHHHQGFGNGSGGGGGNNNVGHRAILVSHPMHQIQLPTSGNVLHPQHRVKFAAEPQITKIPSNNNNNGNYLNQNHQQQQQQTGQQNAQTNGYQIIASNALQRSKSLSSADTLTRGMSILGLGSGNEGTDIGTFQPDIQILIDKAVTDPNQLNARYLMELATYVMQRAVEGRRYALPIARLCIAIIAKEDKETFLEALLNTCRQWYQEREKILYSIQGMKSPSRTRFTAFMAFLTEMFCQLKRRQLQLRTQCDGAPPPLVLLTLLSKCCEDCVKPPVRSLSEIECLFFVLTCIGRDLETHLPQQLESLLSSVRDAFLNASASAPAIRKTLLQLIELQASRWQLPGNTVLYYYPSTK